MDAKKEKQCDELIKAWLKSPIDRHVSMSNKRLWSKQEEILWAIRTKKRIAVKSGNTVGKSFIAADIVFDWLFTKSPSKILTTAPTFNQVADVLWKEIRTTARESLVPLKAIDVLQTSLKINDDNFAVGISTDETARMQGYHSPHLLVILDEASGVMPEIWEAVEALHPECILAIGNPLENTGPFFDCFNSSLWHNITISCEEAVKWQKENGAIPGLVTEEWIKDMEEIHGRNSPWFQIHALGEFPEQSEMSLISRKWVELARKNKGDDAEEDSDKIISCDVATKHGDNETAIVERYGDTIKGLSLHRKKSGTETADRLGLKYNAWHSQTVVVDANGVGEFLEDMLIERKIPVTSFRGGSSQKSFDNSKFKNLRTQFYWVLAKKFEKGMISLNQIGQEEYDILKNQLCSIILKNPDPLGRIQIETKEEMISRGIKSPDAADALMMSEFAIFMTRTAEISPYRYK